MSTYKTVKAIDDFVRGCKTDLVWDKLTEVYLLCAATFPGILCKLKHAGTATLTNNNFVSGDYLAAGSGAGLKGNGSTKYLNTNFNQTALSPSSRSMGIYTTLRGIAGRVPIGSNPGSSYTNCWEWTDRAINGLEYHAENTPIDYTGKVGSSANQFAIGTNSSATSSREFSNGVLVNTRTITAASGASQNVTLFVEGRPTPADYWDGRSTFSFMGTNLTDTDALNLSNRVNALMTALGTNVY